MAEEKNDLEYQNEAYHKVEKSRLQAFMDLFKRQKALPEASETKHKKTNISMETSMNLRAFRRNLVEKVGEFFQSLSRIGAPKKDENPNKFAKEVVGNVSPDKSADRTRNDDDTIHSQGPRYFPGDVSFKKVHEPADTIILAETSVEHDLENETVDESIETDSSIDTGKISVDDTFKASKTSELEASNITIAQNELTKNSNPNINKVIIPGTINKTTKKVDEKDGPEL